MKTVHDCYSDFPLTENYIRQLHKMLLIHASKDERHRGENKTVDNAAASFDAEGYEIGIVFRTASPFDTSFMMRDLAAETNDMLSDPAFSKVIAIGFFIVHFLAIHPFQDGNGRMSRFLTDLLLKSGYSFIEYYSIAKIIEENKSLYCSAMRQTQKTFSDERCNYVPWLSYFTSLSGQRQ